MGAADRRAAAVAAFRGIQHSPRNRPLPERTRCAHHTHTASVLPPHPAQRQVDGGVWAGCLETRGIVESSAPANVATWDVIDDPFGMPRLSIDIEPEDHQKLKAIASLERQSIEDHVLG